MILAAEDVSDDVVLLQRAFGKAGLPCKLVITRNGAETLDFLAEAKTPPRIPKMILLDLVMPVVDGFQVLTWIRGEPRFVQVPIIAVSSSMVPTHRDEALRLGAWEYVTKPFDPGEMIEIFQNLYRRYVAGRNGPGQCGGPAPPG